ncbi:MAG: hypothetical protein MI867_04855 [Pseudomonadales bacterium]|nr:hypothetical protein [Pseudomonadales bacterium]
MIVKFPVFVPRGAAAITIWPFVFTNLDNPPRDLVEHEKVHLRQQVKFLFIGFALLYFGSKKWRYKFELEAYKVSVKYGLSPQVAAEHLSSDLYGNVVTYDQALQDLA